MCRNVLWWLCASRPGTAGVGKHDNLPQSTFSWRPTGDEGEKFLLVKKNCLGKVDRFFFFCKTGPSAQEKNWTSKPTNQGKGWQGSPISKICVLWLSSFSLWQLHLQYQGNISRVQSTQKLGLHSLSQFMEDNLETSVCLPLDISVTSTFCHFAKSSSI